ncbi:glycosyltransferase family 2 protein [Pseudomonas sp. QL9]|uniref:glycosyltransferase family 2 protein n=1 Tax=Pseudomonas sp. QL9 TaxID=3242725 RepID=UPI00352BB2D2
MSEATKNAIRFSIIVPTYNSAATLLLTLESIRDQQWPNTEVLVIDGASKDRTLEIVKSFHGHGLELVVVSEPDKGIYDAINKGIARASGDLICVIGSDDRLAAGALRAVSNAWLANRSDIVAGEALLESPDGTSSKRVDEKYGPGALVSGIPFCHNSMYVTPDAYKRVGGYNLNYKICADAEWTHRSISAGCTCTRIDQVLVHFSLSGTSSSNDDLIMAETYSVIAGNFPGLSIEDAEILFKAVRRWTDDRQTLAVLGRHPSNEALAEAVETGLRPVSTLKISDALVATPVCVNTSLTARALRKILRLFRSRFASN